MSSYKLMRNRIRSISLFSFLLPFLIMLLVFAVKGIYPFGDRSFAVTDMYHQYVPFFAEFLRKLKAGEGLAYSYNIGVGSNFLALYVYYLASPVHFLALLFPEQYLLEFLSYLSVIKIGLCGLTCSYYLRCHFHTSKDPAAILFSVFYALSGFMAAYNWNIMWLDCVILLPLILLGLEQLVKEGRFVLYCVTLALSIYSNYYLSIMICLFLILYFVVQFCLEKGSVKVFLQFAGYSVLAAGMAAVLLIPEVSAILTTDFGQVDFPDKLETYFSVLDTLPRHGIGIEVHKKLDHWPNIYCGAMVMLLIPMYGLNRQIPVKKRFCYLALAGLFLLSFSTNVLDFIWHGLNYPDSLPARQSFLYILLILMMCYEAYLKARKTEPSCIITGYLIAVAWLLFCEKFAKEVYQNGIFLVNLGFVTGYAILLYLRCTRKGPMTRLFIAGVVFALVCSEAFINTYLTSVTNTSRSEYWEGISGQQALYEAAFEREAEEQETETPFFRVEKFSRKTKNDGALTGYPTASVFASTMNSQVANLYERLGMRHSKVYYCFDGATFFTSALLNVKYMIGEDGQEEGPLYEQVAKADEWGLLMAKQSLPFGYVAPFGYDIPEGKEGLELQNQMVKELKITEALFAEQGVQQSGDGILLRVPEDGYYYGVLTSFSTSEVEISRDERIGSLKDLKKGAVLYLGYLTEGEDVLIRNGEEEDTTPQVNAKIFRMDEKVLQEALSRLCEASLTDFTYDSTQMTGKVTLETPGRLILSVPYEKGWKVKLNGEATKVQLFGDAFMAMDLEAGEYDLEMWYVPYGKYAGIAVSLISVVIFIGMVLHSCKNGQEKQMNKQMIKQAKDLTKEQTKEQTG